MVVQVLGSCWDQYGQCRHQQHGLGIHHLVTIWHKLITDVAASARRLGRGVVALAGVAGCGEGLGIRRTIQSTTRCR